jgi:hypothetical protein
MKMNKNIVIILVLTSLLLSAIASALYFYTQGKQVEKKANTLVSIYVAKEQIEEGQLIEEKDLKQIKMAKQFLLSRPPLKNEIVHHYAKTTIYKNEMFRTVKLLAKLQEDSNAMVFEHNSYNMQFNLFQNPNYALQKGDIINIVSIYPKNKEKKNNDFNVQYVAKNIRVLGFVEKGKVVEKPFRETEKMIKEKRSKKEKKVKVTLFADELLLDIESKVIIKLLNNYNKGKQLWMVKTKPDTPTLSPQKTVHYPKQWYKPKTTSSSETVYIHYADNEKATQKVKEVYPSSVKKACSDRSRVIIGVAKRVHLRSLPTFKAKIKRIMPRNTMIPYTKLENGWYKTCDNYFVHKNEAKVLK